jgi:hypothetical protein
MFPIDLIDAGQSPNARLPSSPAQLGSSLTKCETHSGDGIILCKMRILILQKENLSFA